MPEIYDVNMMLFLVERHIEVPFERLLSNPHVNLIMAIDNRKVKKLFYHL